MPTPSRAIFLCRPYGYVVGSDLLFLLELPELDDKAELELEGTFLF